MAEKVDTPGMLNDPHHARGDARLIEQAIKKRWPIPEEVRKRLTEKLADVAMETEKDRVLVSVAKVLKEMEAQNQADDHLAEKNSRLDENKPTENVQVFRLEFDRQG